MSNTGNKIKDDLDGISRKTDIELDIYSHHYLVLKPLYEWMQTVAYEASSGVMFDFGCGGQPYRELFSSKIDKYIGGDVASPENINIDLELIVGKPVPILDKSIDTVLSTQNLEHVPDFNFYLSECNRILKDNGILILTAPMHWRHHEAPYDYWRFTKYGIEEALTQNGFEPEDISACGGSFSLMGQILLNLIVEKRGYQNKVLIKIINIFFSWLDRKYADTDETINWMCLAKKRKWVDKV